jgi:uncharacterized membrane protein YkvA (DUF1232 family)
MVDQKKDFYQDLRVRMREWLKTKEGMDSKWGEYLMFAPDLFHLLCRLSIDKDVPVKEKAKLAGAIAYFVSPIDLLPEALIGPLGFVDDISLAAYVLHSIMRQTSPEIVRKHWSGEEDVLEVVRKILKVADDMVGQGLWRKIKKIINNK